MPQETVTCPRCDGPGMLGGYSEPPYICPLCNGSGYLPVIADLKKDIILSERAERAIRHLGWAHRQLQKENRRRGIQMSRFLGLLQAYIDKPIPSVWERLRRPSV